MAHEGETDWVNQKLSIAAPLWLCWDSLENVFCPEHGRVLRFALLICKYTALNPGTKKEAQEMVERM